MPVLNETNNLGDVLKYETPNLYSREAVTVLAGSGADRVLAVGTAIGRRTKSTAAATADGGNAGDGVAGTVTPGVKAEVGSYTLTCVSTAANAGTFEVLTPKGYQLPDLTVAQAYAGDHLNLTIADGAADFIVGDKFTIDVSGDDKVVALDLTAADGAHEAHGIVAFDVTAPDGTDAESTAIVRDAILADHAVVWPSGITQAQKDTALAELKARGILVRKGA
jgi:hypothetical protein